MLLYPDCNLIFSEVFLFHIPLGYSGKDLKLKRTAFFDPQICIFLPFLALVVHKNHGLTGFIITMNGKPFLCMYLVALKVL